MSKHATAYEARRNPYRVTVKLLSALGYSSREIAAILHLSQSAVMRLRRSKKAA